jgi:hypothetical protein
MVLPAVLLAQSRVRQALLLASAAGTGYMAYRRVTKANVDKAEVAPFRV